jgi:membrane-bound metal-dependent hydrolase YbcI (DUF457 family)
VRWAVVFGPPIALAIVLLSNHLVVEVQDHTALLALVDWSGHLATGAVVLLALASLGVAWARVPAFVIGVLIGSVAVDIDHVPAIVVHSQSFTAGTSRPYAHSIATVVALALIGAALLRRPDPRPGQVSIGLAVGVAFHLLRDAAVPRGVGLALWWPVTERAVQISPAVYVAVVAAAGLVVWSALAGRAALRRR